MSRIRAVCKTDKKFVLPITPSEPKKTFTKVGAFFTLVVVLCSGCGTTKFSDTGRTATEQLLISSAMEDLVDEYDYSRLSGLKVFVKEANSTTDSDYLKSLIRQQLASNGAFVKDSIDDADYIVEMAPGTVGTNRYELMYGIPETTIPALGTITAATSIPEFALIKRTDQKAQIKLRMWAYNKTTGAIIWQSGVDTKSSQIRDRWIFGAGPFTTATYDNVGMRLGADKAMFPARAGECGAEQVSVRSEAVYQELDAKAIERLQKLREEGLKAYEEEVQTDALETEEDAALKEKETADEEKAQETTIADVSVEANNEKTEDASLAPSPSVTKQDAFSVSPSVNTELERAPSPIMTPTLNDPLEIDLGDGKLQLGAVYMPETTTRR